MRVNPPIQPGRVVLRHQPDGSYKPDYIWKALVTISKAGFNGSAVREEGVLLWASTNRRIKAEDRWVNFCTAFPRKT